MRAAIVLLADFAVQNYVSAIAVDLHRQFGVPFYASRLPAHVSLKQPFAFESLDLLDEYFTSLASRVKPFPVMLNSIYYEEWSGYGILGLKVVEIPQLRSLHNLINQELREIFQDPTAAHDGEGYRFHLTIELTTRERRSQLQAYFHHLTTKQVEMTFEAYQMALFYYGSENLPGGNFMTYKILPLGV